MIMERLLLLHGAGINSSRKKLTELKRQFDPNDISIFGEEVSLADLKTHLSSISLFSSNRLVILENPSEEPIPDLPLLTNHLSLILWFAYEINEKKPLMQWVRANKGQVLLFEEAKEASVFPFLDCLGTKDKKAFVKLNELRKEGLEIQYIITMIFYLLRNLTAVKKDAPQFVKQKLQKQRKNFSGKDLVNLYRFVLETDFKIKSGLLEPDLAEFLIVNRFLTG